ncbi:hypothetical protein TWF192_007743 [Orbilia oligospora]|uniref:Uncharacterized protein n=2 Tax=Orbilia oligospora TaxID=2813651 RepID=A0A6G1M432_ORBOL|nr:hypothetical protein TWF191_003305 [Orbilia oligospora]KAF3244449.1 hypothetical protein TWF192_007743 [Orbilia oligospora]
MRSKTLFLGVLGLLLSSPSLATDVKACPADKKTDLMKTACAKQLQTEIEGFTACTAICSRLDPTKPYTPGSPDNSYIPSNNMTAAVFTLEDYKVAEEECGSHEALVKAFEDTCGCYAEGYWKTAGCKIKLGKPAAGGTGSVTSTAFPADTTTTTKEDEPASTSSAAADEEDDEAEETSTAVEEVMTSTSAVYGQMSTSSSMVEDETEALETTTHAMTTTAHKTSMTTTAHTEEEEDKYTSTEAPEPTGRGYGDEETSSSSDDTPMPSTRGYQNDDSTSITSTMEETHKAMTTTKPMTTTSMMDEKPKYVDEETTTDMEESSMMHTTTTHVKPMTIATSMVDEKPKYIDEETTSDMMEETSTMQPTTTMMAATSKHTTATTSHSEMEEEPSSRPAYGGEVEETSTEIHEYTTPSHTKVAYIMTSSSSETMMMMKTSTMMKPVTTHRGYYNEETSSEEVDHTSSSHYTSMKPTKAYYQETSVMETSTEAPRGYYTTASEEETTTQAPRGYTTPPAKYDDQEASTSSMAMETESEHHYNNHTTHAPVGYNTMEESTMEESSTKTPMKYTTMEESTKTPMKYTTMEESSEPATSSTAMEESTKLPMAYTSAAETKTAMPYQTTSWAMTSKEHPTTTTKPSATMLTMDLCARPTDPSDSGDEPRGYEPPTSLDFGCLSPLSGASRDILCQEASMTSSNNGKWGQLNAKPLKAYQEGYSACGEQLPHMLKKICNCIDPEYTGPVPTDKPTNLMPETLPPVCSVKPCPNKDKVLPKNCLKHIEEYSMDHKQSLCGMLCNKKEGGVDLDPKDLKYYWTFHDRCGTHESFVTALTQSCGCIIENFGNGTTCVYPRTGPKEDTRSLTSEATTYMKSTTSMVYTSMPVSYTAAPVYGTQEPDMTTSTAQPSTTVQPPKTSMPAQPPKKAYVVEECPKDYDGKGEWPSGNCLDEVFGTKEGMAVADMICNNQCADFQQTEWPATQMESYKKALMKCKTPMEITKALAKGCGCLNDGWVDRCRPQCHPPPGFTTTTIMMPQTSAQPMITTTSMAPPPPPMQDTTITASWTATTYVTKPCNECQPTTIVTMVPCSETKLSTTSMMAISSETSTTTPMVYSTSMTPTVSIWTPEPYVPAPITSPTTWSTITYTTTKCGGCPETTVTTTVPCPQTLSKVKTDAANADLCTTHNETPHCTVPPGKLEGKAYNSNCNQWYLIKEGDTCLGVADKIPVDMDLLKAWNGMQPTDNCTCTTGRWLCVSLLQGKDKNESVRYVKGRPTYSDYGPEATNYDNLPKPSPRPYLAEPVPTAEAAPVAYS